MALPIFAALESGNGYACHFTRRMHWDAEQNDAARRRKMIPESQFAEILVKRDKEAPVCFRSLEDLDVWSARALGTCPTYVVTPCSQSLYRLFGEVLVGLDPHELHSGGIEFFRMQYIAGVSQTGVYVFDLNSGIVVENIVIRPALREKIYDKLDRETRAPDYGLPNQHIGIEGNTLVQSHCATSHDL